MLQGYFGYNINMKTVSVIKYRNFFILLATFSVLCLSPLADIHFEVNSHEKAYVHGHDHNETTFSLFIHELLFTHLQHTFDHVTLGIAHQILKKNKYLTSKETIFSSSIQPFFASDFTSLAVHSSTPIKFLHKNKQTAGIYSRELSGLSPPNILS
jgi:hypothetical protein